uniref:Uncharacterized protein n=1 Tax=Avena sativa TaxID=4498 RepID=A0ACD5UKK3_AVESA
MGCVSSTFLEDDERRIIGVSASSSASSHIVSLTSSTYGILTYNLAADDHPSAPKSTPPPPPPPPPPLSLPSRSKPKTPADAQPGEETTQPEHTEVINSWELMAGLSTPAKSKPAASPRRPDTKDKDPDGKPRRSIRFPLRPIDGNVSVPAHAHTAGLPPIVPTTPPPPPQHRCPPHCVVLYTTTLRALRATFEACNAARAALQSHGDVSMDRGLRDELRALLPLPLPLTLPRLFVRGRHVGGAEEVLRMDEVGALGPLLDGLPRARSGGRCCDGCGGMRFLPCFDCSGSRKVVVAAGAGGAVKGRRERGVLMRCGECNENGLVLCPLCS